MCHLFFFGIFFDCTINKLKNIKMANGKINVAVENIFPLIKKFLYSDHEIFLRELISNATDAISKLKHLSSIGEVKGEIGDPRIEVKIDKDNKKIHIIDQGVGMTTEEVNKYINEVAFSGAEEFLEKYKDNAKDSGIIGHFGLGFYSAFMVAEKVEIITKSHQDAPAAHWTCDGSPEYTLEEADKKESLLPDKPPKEQYEFAVSFMKVGDYETAEFALKEFIDKNKDHDLAGSAQYWYGETFRIRQLYSDAATAYLDGYQNYPKSKKAPDNLLKLGITMVELGEKDQGCKMISGLKKEYPKASKSVLQKAQYEQKKFKCKS